MLILYHGLRATRPSPHSCVCACANQVIVFGGNGFVGQAVCRAALDLGADVVSVSRSGSPNPAPAWASQVQWLKGDIFSPQDYSAELAGATGVVR
jgi:uncharacterized protein YbjT (DUF2867 family)